MNKPILLAILFTSVSFRIQAQPIADYDGNVYQSVTIGTQVWMRENLKSVHYSDSTSISGVSAYNDSDSLAAIYGRLYSWAAAMHGAEASNSIPSGVQGVCPAGWHMPSSAEWQILIDYYGGDWVAGGKLKEADTIHWFPPNTGATNESGFTALAGGDRNEPGGFFNLMGYTGMWQTSQRVYDEVTSFNLGNESAGAMLIDSYIGQGYNSQDISVRCLKNSSATAITDKDDAKHFSVYPNPADKWIIIQLENSPKTDLSIYGIEGKLMLQKQLMEPKTSVDISALPEGVYIISIRNSQGIMQKRLVKSRSVY